MPQAISTEFLSSYKKNKIFYDHKESPIIITHAVYAKEVIKTKGSHIISEAIDKLKAKGVNIDYRFYIGKPHEFIIEQIFLTFFILKEG